MQMSLQGDGFISLRYLPHCGLRSHLLCAQRSLFFRSSPTSVIFGLFYYSHSCGGEVLPPRGFALQFSGEHFVTYLVATLTFYLEGDLVKCIALCKAGYLVRCCWGEGLVLLSLRGSGLWPAGSITAGLFWGRVLRWKGARKLSCCPGHDTS